jgi:hypothetical protein
VVEIAREQDERTVVVEMRGGTFEDVCLEAGSKSKMSSKNTLIVIMTSFGGIFCLVPLHPD